MAKLINADDVVDKIGENDLSYMQQADIMDCINDIVNGMPSAKPKGMTMEQYMLVVLSEECAEITQAASKALRFGLDNRHPNKPDVTNESHLLEEYYQLQAVMELMMNHSIIKVPDQEWIDYIKQAKQGAIWDYMEVSRKNGRLM